MLYWETADENPSAADHELEFARIWKDTPRIVFSNTLEKVEGNARLATDGVAEEVAKLKEEPGKDLAVGGAGLASTCIELGLVDEYRLFVNPVVLGGGTPYFPALDERIDLELIETRTFGVPRRLRSLPACVGGGVGGHAASLSAGSGECCSEPPAGAGSTSASGCCSSPRVLVIAQRDEGGGQRGRCWRPAAPAGSPR